MTASVTHAKVVLTPDDGTSEVGSDEWNDEHSVSIAPADIGASADTHDHDAAYDAIGAASSAETAAESYADGAVGTHTGDTSAAHAASAVAVTPVGAVAATDVQAAIQELDSEKSATGHDHAAAYDAIGAAATAQSTAEGYADGAVSTHAGLADPHTGYLLESAAGGTPAPVLSTSNAAGNATTYLRTNDQLALFDATAPAKPTSVGAVGTAAFAARRDHQHPNKISTTGLRIESDFLYQTASTTAGTIYGHMNMSLAGTAAGSLAQPLTSVPNHPGILGLTTGSTSTGAVNLAGGGNSICLGGGRARYGVWIYLPLVGTSAQRYEVLVGFADATTSAAVVDGCFFTYKDIINSGAWQVTTVSNSTSTATVTTTGVTMNAATWYLLEAEVNAAGSSVTYTVNGANPVTHNANVPNGAGRETDFFVCACVKTVGATASTPYLDAYYLELDFTTPR